MQGCTLTRAKSILSSDRCQKVASLNDRIAEFIVDRFPDEGSPVELLCIDHNGTYVVLSKAWRSLLDVKKREAVAEATALPGWASFRAQSCFHSVSYTRSRPGWMSAPGKIVLKKSDNEW